MAMGYLPMIRTWYWLTIQIHHMKKFRFILLLLIPFYGSAQPRLGIGIKAGLNFAGIKEVRDVNTDTRTGYMVGAYFSPGRIKTIGYRSEVILSRQGYDYKTSTNTGTVNLDYLLLPQLLTIRFSPLIQVHAGGQLAFLLNSGVDSSGNNSGSLLDYFKRFDYGFAGGVEVHPIKILFIGARLNVSLRDIHEEAPLGGSWPNFIPRISAKNNVLQVYAGLRF